MVCGSFSVDPIRLKVNKISLTESGGGEKLTLITRTKHELEDLFGKYLLALFIVQVSLVFAAVKS